MAPARSKRIGELEIEEDIAHQHHEWKAERIGWVLMALFLIAAMLGLLGPGPLSNATAGERGSDLWVDYQRFGRYAAPFEIKVHFKPQPGGDTRISLNRAFYEGVEVESITPEPEKSEILHDRAVFHFATGNDLEETAVTFFLRPKQRGRQQVQVGLNEREPLPLGVVIYP